MGDRRSLWMFGLESEEPSYEHRVEMAAILSRGLGVPLVAPRIPTAEDLELRPPRISPPERLRGFCRQDNWDRAYHSYGNDRTLHGPFGDYPNPPDVVAHPRNEVELEAVLDWCAGRRLLHGPVRRGQLGRGRRDAAGRRGERP